MNSLSQALLINSKNMKYWIAISHRLNNINKSFAILARWAVLLMLILGLWNVIGRYLGVAIGQNLSSNRLIEAQWYLFDVIFLLGLGWTLQCKGHVRVDVLQSNWSSRRKAKIELLGTIFLLLPFAIGVMAISIEPTLLSWLIGEASPDPHGLPRYWIKSLIPIGFLLLALQGISEAIQKASELKGSLLSQESQDSNYKENRLD